MQEKEGDLKKIFIFNLLKQKKNSKDSVEKCIQFNSYFHEKLPAKRRPHRMKPSSDLSMHLKM